jgi:hypothetical protein
MLLDLSDLTALLSTTLQTPLEPGVVQFVTDTDGNTYVEVTGVSLNTKTQQPVRTTVEPTAQEMNALTTRSRTIQLQPLQRSLTAHETLEPPEITEEELMGGRRG